jgi:hypothetical protein
MFLRFNNDKAPNAQFELVSESDQTVVAEGYLDVSMVPVAAGDRINGLTFVATNVLVQPDGIPALPVGTVLSEVPRA